MINLTANICNNRYAKEQNVSITSFSSNPDYPRKIKNDEISFGIKSKEFKKTIKAIKYVRNALEKDPFMDLSELNPKKLERILVGTVFEKLKAHEFIKFTQEDVFLTMEKGCNNACGHCYISALPINKADNNRKMDIRNFTNLAEGIKITNKRAGINLFQWSNKISRNIIKIAKNLKDKQFLKTINNNKFTLCYLENDPIFTRLGENDIVDLGMTFYDNTGTPFRIITAGWDIKDVITQKTAKKLKEKICENPDTFDMVIISIHPFIKTMIKSNNYLKIGDETTATQLKNEYVERMANVLKTFLPLFKIKKARIDLLYAPDLEKNAGYRLNGAQKLYYDIISKLSKHEINFDENTVSILIDNQGRGTKYFDNNSPQTKEFPNYLFIDTDGKLIQLNGMELCNPNTKNKYKDTGIKLAFI